MEHAKPTTSLKAELLAAAEKHCAARGISEARLGNIVAKDARFFSRLRAGGDCTTGMYERFQTYFAEAADAA